MFLFAASEAETLKKDGWTVSLLQVSWDLMFLSCLFCEKTGNIIYIVMCRTEAEAPCTALDLAFPHGAIS